MKKKKLTTSQNKSFRSSHASSCQVVVVKLRWERRRVEPTMGDAKLDPKMTRDRNQWKLFTQQVVMHYIRCQQGQIVHLTCSTTQVYHFFFFFFFPKFTSKLPNLKYIKLSYTIISRQGNYKKKLATNKPPSHKKQEEGGQGLGALHVSSLFALSYPFPHCSPPFPPHKQWIVVVVRVSAWWWWC